MLVIWLDTSQKPSLSKKILFINNFATKILIKLLSDLCIGVHLKGTKKFGSKVINVQFLNRKTVFAYENIVYYELYFQTF